MSGDAEILNQDMVHSRARIWDFIELMKPELTGLSVLTALCGFYLASDGPLNLLLFGFTALGTIMLGGGAGALNQYMERDYDALMKRTERRPLPAGRLSPLAVLWFGTILSIAGILILTFTVNYFTGFLGSLTFVSYVFVYTPLKRVTPLSTLIGGIPGALPPMMGWTAAENQITTGAWVLFAILFFWQMPHFLSLAWMYRKDYARANYKMLSVIDESGKRTSWQSLLFCAALIPTGIALTFLGVTGTTFLWSSVVLGVGFIAYTLLFVKHSGQNLELKRIQANLYSRKVFFASLIYLPALMIIMVIDKV